MAPVKCYYRNCNNTSASASVFSFPVKNDQRLQTWLRHSGNADLALLTHKELSRRYICAAHFEEKFVIKHVFRSTLLKNALPKPYNDNDVDEDNTLNMKPETNTVIVKIETELEDEAEGEIDLYRDHVASSKNNIPNMEVKSNSEVFEVKIETESEDEAEGEIDLYRDHVASARSNMLDTEIKSEVFDVKTEPESDGEAESVTDLYTDHMIKEEMAIGPVLLQPAVYNYSTNCSKADIHAPGRLNTNVIPSTWACYDEEPSPEPSLVLRPVTRMYCRPGRNAAARRFLYVQETEGDETDKFKPQEQIKDDSEEFTSSVDLKENSLTDIETREKVKNEEPNKNVNLLKRCHIENSPEILNDFICNDNDYKHFGKSHNESHEKTNQVDNLKFKEDPDQTKTHDLLEEFESQDANSNFVCDMNTLKKKCKLNNHMNLKDVHSNNMIREDSICNYATVYNSDIKEHKINSKRKSFSYICDNKTIQKFHLTPHLRTYSREKQFKCKQPTDLSLHLSKDADQKPYSSSCEFVLTEKNSLKKHSIIHTGLKPHPCPFCDKQFSHRATLTTHLHTCTRKKYLYYL